MRFFEDLRAGGGNVARLAARAVFAGGDAVDPAEHAIERGDGAESASPLYSRLFACFAGHKNGFQEPYATVESLLAGKISLAILIREIEVILLREELQDFVRRSTRKTAFFDHGLVVPGQVQMHFDFAKRFNDLDGFEKGSVLKIRGY